MKDSGIEWIGEIPNDWDLRKGKALFCQRNERGNNINLQLLSPSQKLGVVPQLLLEERTSHVAVKVKEETDLMSFKTIHKGDFCISLRSFQGGFEYSTYEGVVSPAYQVFYPIETICDKFYKYMFKIQPFIDKMNSYAMTLRDGKNISFSDFANSYIPFPSVSVQHKITAYLDKQCAKIDRLIAHEEAMIEELKAFKQSVIFEAVTKGLDKSVPMKDSGVEWIGKIPESWDIQRIKKIFYIIGGCGFSDHLQGKRKGTYPFCKASDINGDSKYINSAQNYVDDKEVVSERFKVIPAGSIIFSKIGEAMKKNHRKINLIPCIVDNNCQALVPTIGNINYFYYVFTQIDMVWFDNAGTIPCVNNERLLNLKIPELDILLQQQIADYLDKKCADIDNLVSIKRRKIEKLKEYKKSLIYEYVTGKKEVA